jgi:hypothetical protein
MHVQKSKLKILCKFIRVINFQVVFPGKSSVVAVLYLLIILLISSCHVCYYYLCYHIEQILCTTVLTMVFKK